MIEISTLAQLDAIRHDLDGDGVARHTAAYNSAFPNAAPNMGCGRRQCQGYELAADLDFDTNGNGYIDPGDTYWKEGYGWEAIAHINLRFQSTMEGNGHTIANLHVTWAETTYRGLFSALGDVAVIRNLKLTHVDITGTERVGALAGFNNGRVHNVHVLSGTVAAADHVGGLVGYNYNSGNIFNSSSAAIVNGNTRRVGGLVGYNTGQITGSHATGDTTGKGDEIGGLVGYNHGDITASHAAGQVTGNQAVGGLVGLNQGDARHNSEIIASYATGDVNGDRMIGGLIGHNQDDYGFVKNTYATGKTTGRELVFGLIGYTSGRVRKAVTNSYAIGKVTGDRRTVACSELGL